MDKRRFTELDATILFFMPKVASTVEQIARSYSFMNRDALPSDETILNCMHKAIAADIIEKVGTEYVFRPDWFEIIHQFDSSSENEFEALFKFEEMILAKINPPGAPEGGARSKEPFPC